MLAWLRGGWRVAAFTRVYFPNLRQPQSRLMAHAQKQKRRPTKKNDPWASPRQQTFLASQRLQALAKQHRFLDAMAAILGPIRLQNIPWLDGPLSRSSGKADAGKVKQTLDAGSLPKPIPRGALLRPESWNTLLAMLAKQGWVDACWRVYTVMRRQAVQPTQQTFSLLLEASANHLKQFPPAPKRTSTKPIASRAADPTAVSKLSTQPAVSSKRVFERARMLYQWINRPPPAPVALGRRGNRRVRHPHAAHITGGSSLPALPPPPINRYIINAMLKCASWAGDWETVESVYGQMCLSDSLARRHLDPWLREDQAILKSLRGDANRSRFHDRGSIDKSLTLVPSSPAAGQQDWIQSHLDKAYGPRLDTLEGNRDSKSTPSHSVKPLVPSQAVRPDLVTFSVVLSACAVRGGDDGYRMAVPVWEQVLADCLESRSTMLKQRERVVQLRLQSLRRGQGDVEPRLGKQKTKQASGRWVVLSEEDYKAFQAKKAAIMEADLAFPFVQLDADLVNTMLLVTKQASKLAYLEWGLLLASQHFPWTCDWSGLLTWLEGGAESNAKPPPVPKETESLIHLLRRVIRANTKTIHHVLETMERLGVAPRHLGHVYKYLTDPAFRKQVRQPSSNQGGVLQAGTTIAPDELLSQRWSRFAR